MAITTPTFNNDYLVRFHEHINVGASHSVTIWENPFVEKMNTIQTFIPECSRQTSNIFKIHVDNGHVWSIYWLDPIAKNILATIDTKDLMNFSVASKCCYIAAKSDVVWQSKIKFSFCNVECLPENKCSFSPEQQFQIAFKKLQFRQSPYLCQHDHNIEKYSNKIPNVLAQVYLIDPAPTKVYNLREELKTLINLFGRSCVGTVESIEPESEQGRCIAALDLIHDELNNQDAFVKMIQASLIAANTTSIRKVDPGKIEELSDCMGPDDDYHFLTIENIFGSGFSPLTNEQISSALSAFENIQSGEFKIKAFTLILINDRLTDGIATSFYEALPEALQNKLKDQMAADGHALNADQLSSQNFKDAAFQVYVNLKRTG